MACPWAANSTISTKARCRRPCGSGRCSDHHNTETVDMTKRRFGRRLAWVAAMAVTCAAPAAIAQQTEPAPKAGTLINAGDVLSGELNTLRVRGGKKGKRVATYQ